jgi:CHC2 zinc finger/Toprim domain
LPSGRRLAYPQARLGPGKYEGRREVYFKSNARGGWADERNWYGTFTENVVQATARDLLAHAMLGLERAGYPVVLHVHDEVVCEVPEDFGSEDEFRRIMLDLPDWAAGLPVAGKVRSGKRYAKSSSKRAPENTTQTKPAQPRVGFSGVVEIPGKANERTSDAPIGSESEHNLVDDNADDEDELGEIPLADLIGEPLIDGKILCPFHDDHSPSLVIYDDHYHCYACGAHGGAVDWLTMVEGMNRRQASQHLATWDGPRVAPRQDDEDDSRDYALQLWGQGGPITGTTAARYLSDVRGIDLTALPANIDDVLRFHPRCPFAGAYHPCLVALMRNVTTDAPTGIHRIALTPAVLTGSQVDRRMLGHAGVVKLWPATAQLVVGEGIETVLAAANRIPYRDAPLQPAWSTISAGPLGNLPVLPGVERLIALVDHDPGGKSAALTCTARWTRAGRTVVRLMHPRPGADFNDFVMPESVS